VSLREIYFFSAEKSALLEMKNDETAFSEKGTLTGQPLFVLRSYDEEHCAIIYPPAENKSKKTITLAQLTIFNCRTGEPKKTIALGYSPLKWTYTRDRKNLFIVYQTDPKVKNCELFHYDFVEGKEEKLSGFGMEVWDLVLSQDQSSLYCTYTEAQQTSKNKKDIAGVFGEIKFPNLEIKGKIPINNYPTEKIFALRQGKAAVMEMRFKLFGAMGDVKLIDPATNQMIDQKDIKSGMGAITIDEKNGVFYLFNYMRIFKNNSLGIKSLSGNCRMIRVSADGLMEKEFPEAYINSKYDSSNDRLILLLTDSVIFIDKSGAVTQIESDSNFLFSGKEGIAGEDGITPMGIYLIKDPSLIAVANKEGLFRFYNYQDNKPIAEVKGQVLKQLMMDLSRASDLISLEEQIQTFEVSNRRFFENQFSTLVLKNPANGRIYLLNKKTNDLNILDKNFEELTHIAPKERIVSLFQLAGQEATVIVSTTKGLYRLNFATDEFIPIYQFPKEIIKDSLIMHNKKLVYLSDKEYVMIDPSTWQVQNSSFYRRKIAKSMRRSKRVGSDTCRWIRFKRD
jgi:hypothetical protein